MPIFATLNEEELNRVVDLIVRRQHSKGEILLLEDTNLDSLIIINHGKVKAFRYTQEGKEQILYIFSEGDFYGEKNLLSGQMPVPPTAKHLKAYRSWRVICSSTSILKTISCSNS